MEFPFLSIQMLHVGRYTSSNVSKTAPGCNVAPHNIVSLYHRQSLVTKDTLNIAYPLINAGFSIAGLTGSVICLLLRTVHFICVIPASSFEMHFVSISNIATAQEDINPYPANMEYRVST